MKRKQVGLAMLRAYPREVRAAHGEEMIGTLLDAGEDSALAFVRESVSLVPAGLRERASVTARVGTRRLLADACCRAAVIWIVSALIQVTAMALGRAHGLDRSEYWAMALWVVLACSLIGYDRIAGVGGVLLITRNALVQPGGTFFLPIVYAAMLVPLVCFVVMIMAPRVRRRDLRRLLWLIPIGVLILIPQPAHSGLGVIVFVAAVSLSGIALLPADPRLAIAAALWWTSAGVVYLAESAQAHQLAVPGLLLLATTPVVLMIAAARLRSVRRQLVQ